MSLLSKLMGALGGSGGTELPADFLLLDVRSEMEFRNGAIEGAVWIPLQSLDDQVGKLMPDRNQPVVAYCASGARSGWACGRLAELGYTQTINGGGIRSLADRLQRPVVRP